MKNFDYLKFIVYIRKMHILANSRKADFAESPDR